MLSFVNGLRQVTRTMMDRPPTVHVGGINLRTALAVKDIIGRRHGGVHSDPPVHAFRSRGHFERQSIPVRVDRDIDVGVLGVACLPQSRKASISVISEVRLADTRTVKRQVRFATPHVVTIFKKPVASVNTRVGLSECNKLAKKRRSSDSLSTASQSIPVACCRGNKRCCCLSAFVRLRLP